MEKCLLDVSLTLQKEIDKHLGGFAADNPSQQETNDALNNASSVQVCGQSTTAADDDDPDGMMAAFFAKQKALAEKAEKLPFEDWAPLFAAVLRDQRINNDNNNKMATAPNDNLSDSEMDLINRLWEKFSSLQES